MGSAHDEDKDIEEKVMLFQLLGQLNNISFKFKNLSDRERKELKDAFDDENGLGKWRADRLWLNYVDLDPWHRLAGTLDALRDILGPYRIKQAIGEFTREDISILVLMDERGVQLLSTSHVDLKEELNKNLKEEWEDILAGKNPLYDV